MPQDRKLSITEAEAEPCSHMTSGKPFPLTNLSNGSMKPENRILMKASGLKMVTWAPMVCQGSLSPHGCLTWHLS